MQSETESRIEQLETQVLALKHLLYHALVLIESSCLASYQVREKERVTQLISTLKSVKFSRR